MEGAVYSSLLVAILQLLVSAPVFSKPQLLSAAATIVAGSSSTAERTKIIADAVQNELNASGNVNGSGTASGVLTSSGLAQNISAPISASSAAGLDVNSPQHLKDLISRSVGDAALDASGNAGSANVNGNGTETGGESSSEYAQGLAASVAASLSPGGSLNTDNAVDIDA